MANPATLIEDDDDLAAGGDQQPAAPAAPAALRPAAQPPIRPSAASAPDEEFDVVEVDERGRPYDGQPERQAPEGTLSEADAGGETLVEQRQREADQAAGRQQPSKSMLRKQAQRDAKERKDKETRELRRKVAEQDKRIEELTGRFGAVEPRVLELGDARIKDMAAQLDAQIASAGNEVATAQRQLIEAWDSGDKAAMAEALALRDKAFLKQARLENTKASNAARVAREDRAGAEDDTEDRIAGDRAVVPRNASQRPQGPQPLPRDVQRFVDEFADEFDWYDPTGNDRDSRRVLRLDNEIASEGFKPNTDEYWDELRARMREILPAERFATDETAANTNTRQNGNGHDRTRAAVPQTRRGPMTAGGGDRPAQGAGGKTQVRITPERKTAMIQAGIIGEDGIVVDQTKYTRVLKSYLAHDRANGAARP